jgi:tetratricopeptide (TPR) repeat protein
MSIMPSSINEERRNAYYQLIDALLTCPSCEESVVLQANQDLVDAGLLQTMEEAARQLAERGDEKVASWLRNFAAQLAAVKVNLSMWIELKAEAERLLKQGDEQYQTSAFGAALQSWQQALSLYEALRDRHGKAMAMGNLGIVYQILGDYGKAIEYEQKLLAIARENRDFHAERQALGNLAAFYISLEDYQKAIDYCEQSLAIAQELQDHKGEGLALGNLGTIYNCLGSYTKAIESHQQCLAIARELQDRHMEERSLGNLGLVYDALGDHTQAIEYHQQSLGTCGKIEYQSL